MFIIISSFNHQFTFPSTFMSCKEHFKSRLLYFFSRFRVFIEKFSSLEVFFLCEILFFYERNTSVLIKRIYNFLLCVVISKKETIKSSRQKRRSFDFN